MYSKEKNDFEKLSISYLIAFWFSIFDLINSNYENEVVSSKNISKMIGLKNWYM